MGKKLKPVPSFSATGWVNSPVEKMDRVFSYFILSQKSQLTLIQGKVRSLPYIVKTCGKDKFALKSEIKNGLLGIFGDYFDDVNVEVEIVENGADLEIKTYVDAIEDGVMYKLGRAIYSNNSIIKRVLTLANTGV